MLTYKFQYGLVKIFWNNILFICYNAEQFTGLVSSENNGRYYIVVHCNTKEIKVELDTKKKWIAILKLLDKIIDQK